MKNKFWTSKWFSVVLEVVVCIGTVIMAFYLSSKFIKQAEMETLKGAITMLQSFNSGLETAPGQLIAACVGVFIIPALLISVVIVGWIGRFFAWVTYRDDLKRKFKRENELLEKQSNHRVLD